MVIDPDEPQVTWKVSSASCSRVDSCLLMGKFFVGWQ
jgi:hypothetical protein